MREILFKAKLVDNGKWVEGSLINRHEHYAENIKEYCAIVIFDKGSDSSYDAYLELEVHPETVCQFTGLLDKNRNKIFEGDRLNYTITPMNGKTTIIPYLVVFNVDGFQVLNLIKKFKAPYIDGLFYRAPKRMTYKDWSKCEIIGNIHD